MRIGIFGGAFDPPHMGHITVAAYALATARLDILWVIPCWKHAFDKKMSLFEDRDRMCREAFPPVFGDRVKVLPIEAILKTQYTVDLIEELHRQNPNDQLVMIIGWDEFQNLDKWHRIDDLRKLVEFFPVSRGMSRHEMDFVVPDVNSTFIRKILTGFAPKVFKQWIPTGVIAYIEKYGLYKNN